MRVFDKYTLRTIIIVLVIGLTSFFIQDNINRGRKELNAIRSTVNDLTLYNGVNWAYCQSIMHKYGTMYEILFKELNEIVIENELRNKNLNNINTNLNKLKNITKDLKNIALPADYEFLKAINMEIINDTFGISGSGSIIKLEEEYYILSCGHLIMTTTDKYLAQDTIDKTKYPLTLIKYNSEIDLSLFKIELNEGSKYIEISKDIPTIGDTVFIIGNPSNLIDVVTSGVISREDKNNYYVEASSFYGNSGGGVIYKGKLIGVLVGFNALLNKIEREDGYYYVDFKLSRVIKLETIKKFLDN